MKERDELQKKIDGYEKSFQNMKDDLSFQVGQKNDALRRIEELKKNLKNTFDHAVEYQAQLARAKECFFEITNAWNLQLGDHVPNIRVRFEAEWTRRVVEGKE